MNLHGIVRGAITAVNPDETLVISESTGYTQDPDGDGTQIPTYNSFQTAAQIQALTGKDIKLLDGMNLNGDMRAIYFYGDIQATLRALRKGGDVIFRPLDGSTWLVTQVLETWPDWCKIAATRQLETQ